MKVLAATDTVMSSVTTHSNQFVLQLWNVKKILISVFFSLEYSSMTTLCLHVVTNDWGRNTKESYNDFAKLTQGVENLNEVQTNPIKIRIFTLSWLQAVTAT